MQQTIRCGCCSSRLQLKCDGTRWRTGGEVKGKLSNAVGSQYSSHYLGTRCIKHYYRWWRTPRFPQKALWEGSNHRHSHGGQEWYWKSCRAGMFARNTSATRRHAEPTRWKIAFTKFIHSFIHSFIHQYSDLEAGLAGTRAQSCEWYGFSTLHPGQVLGGSLQLLSPRFTKYTLLFTAA